MTSAALTSRTLDRVALGVAALYGVGVIAWMALLAVYMRQERWVVAAGALLLVGLFIAFTYAWAQAAICRITLEDGTLQRTGPLGWRVSRTDRAWFDMSQVHGRPYLVVMPQDSRGRRNLSRLFVGKKIPLHALTGPLQTDQVEAFEAALGGPLGRPSQ